MIDKKVYYQWKTIGNDCFLPVQPTFAYEQSVGDMLFSSPEEASSALDRYKCKSEALEDKWVLVKVTYEVVKG